MTANFVFTDIDECLDRNACPENGFCTNTEGSFTCECEHGFHKARSDNDELICDGTLRSVGLIFNNQNNEIKQAISRKTERFSDV